MRDGLMMGILGILIEVFRVTWEDGGLETWSLKRVGLSDQWCCDFDLALAWTV